MHNTMKKLLTTLLLLLATTQAIACTTAVLSGRFTKNGRPMIWKLRDTEAYDNHMQRFESPLGYYVGLVNDSDTLGLQVWGGHNSHGFAIMIVPPSMSTTAILAITLIRKAC